MIILGIDPALTKTGWGVISSLKNTISYIGSGTIKTNASEDLPTRLSYIHQEIKKVIETYNPSEVAIEETFVNQNPISSLKLGHARGVLILSAAMFDLKVYEYSSTAIKKAIVGVGRAEKNQVETMIKFLLPKSVAKTEDEADALAVAICHNNNKIFR